MRRIEFDIDEKDQSTGVKAISIVDQPALESDFVTLSKKVEYIKLAGPYKQILAGLALIPDKDIPRVSPKGEKYLAYFTKEGIERIRNKFHKELMNNRVNVDHSQADYIDAYMVESFLIDSDQRLEDVKSKGVKDPVMGSWFVAYKIEDEQVFNKALAGELRGFSVEIFIKSMFEEVAEDDRFKSIDEKLDRILKGEISIKYEDFINNNLKPKSFYEDRLKQLQNKLSNVNS